jgi:hypothetical protein
MPLHVAPALRILEQALEMAGLIPVANSDAVNQAEGNEAMGAAVQVVPVGWQMVINGVQYTPAVIAAPTSGVGDVSGQNAGTTPGEVIPVVSGDTGDSAVRNSRRNKHP